MKYGILRCQAIAMTVVVGVMLPGITSADDPSTISDEAAINLYARVATALGIPFKPEELRVTAQTDVSMPWSGTRPVKAIRGPALEVECDPYEETLVSITNRTQQESAAKRGAEAKIRGEPLSPCRKEAEVVEIATRYAGLLGITIPDDLKLRLAMWRPGLACWHVGWRRAFGELPEDECWLFSNAGMVSSDPVAGYVVDNDGISLWIDDASGILDTYSCMLTREAYEKNVAILPHEAIEKATERLESIWRKANREIYEHEDRRARQDGRPLPLSRTELDAVQMSMRRLDILQLVATTDWLSQSDAEGLIPIRGTELDSQKRPPRLVYLVAFRCGGMFPPRNDRKILDIQQYLDPITGATLRTKVIE